MIDAIIGIFIAFSLLAVVVLLLFLGIWIAMFCKTMKEMDRASEMYGFTKKKPHIKYRKKEK